MAFSGHRNRKYQEGIRRRRAKAAASKDAPAREADRPRTAEDWAAIKLAATEARKAMLATARAARAASTQQEETLEALCEKLHRAEELLEARDTEIATLKAKVRHLDERSPPPKMSRSLHRQVLSLLHPDRVHDDEELRRKLEKCFQAFSAIKFTFPE
jgi:hypothetical protein